MQELTIQDFLTELKAIMQQPKQPEVLTAEHIAEIMHISKRMAYEIMERKDFPTIRIGKLKRANREAFFRWLENQKV